MPASTRQPGRRSKSIAIASIAVVAAVVVVAVLVAAQRPRAPQTAQSQNVRRLTFEPGVERDPALSPDGRVVVYAAPGEGGVADLFAKDLDTDGGAVNLTRPPDAVESAPAFSVDGAQLAWGVRDADGEAVWLGGPRAERPRRVVRGAATPTFSPDGRALVVGTAGFDEPERVSTTAAGATIEYIDIASGARRVVHAGAPSFEPSMSPGGHIASWATDSAGRRDIFTVDRNGGAPTRITDDDAVDFHPRFSADGRVVHSLSNRGGAMALWSIAVDAVDADGAAASAPVLRGRPVDAVGVSGGGARRLSHGRECHAHRAPRVRRLAAGGTVENGCCVASSQHDARRVAANAACVGARQAGEVRWAVCAVATGEQCRRRHRRIEAADDDCQARQQRSCCDVLACEHHTE